MDTIGVILVRGGSKGIRRKNLQQLGNRTLVERCIHSALLSKLPRVWVSTDNDEIAELLHNRFCCGYRFNIHRREDVPDEQTSEDGVCMVLDDPKLVEKRGTDEEVKHVMLLQATSPGLGVNDINDALDKYDRKTSVISAWQFWGMVGEQIENADGDFLFSPRFIPLNRLRQYRVPLLVEAGSLYLAPVDAWRAGNRIVGEPRVVLVGRWRAVEIDEPIDLESWRRCKDLWRSEKP